MLNIYKRRVGRVPVKVDDDVFVDMNNKECDVFTGKIEYINEDIVHMFDEETGNVCVANVTVRDAVIKRDKGCVYSGFVSIKIPDHFHPDVKCGESGELYTEDVINELVPVEVGEILFRSDINEAATVVAVSDTQIVVESPNWEGGTDFHVFTHENAAATFNGLTTSDK